MQVALPLISKFSSAGVREAATENGEETMWSRPPLTFVLSLLTVHHQHYDGMILQRRPVVLRAPAEGNYPPTASSINSMFGKMMEDGCQAGHQQHHCETGQFGRGHQENSGPCKDVFPESRRSCRHDWCGALDFAPDTSSQERVQVLHAIAGGNKLRAHCGGAVSLHHWCLGSI